MFTELLMVDVTVLSVAKSADEMIVSLSKVGLPADQNYWVEDCVNQGQAKLSKSNEYALLHVFFIL